ncbi:hypothetical protein ACFCVY_10435 [Streptomyces sp. NPDC056411]|uniref:hypothetical protein n=1 Tax=Streptomyces sp. NPDC056411 TaxID=3345813 RepID=UPI0035DFD921
MRRGVGGSLHRGGVPETRDNQERRVRLHIVPHLGELALRNITAADLRAYVAKLEATVSAVDHRRSILSELSSILERAVDDKRLARNPMDAKSVRWPTAPQERRDAGLLETALRVRDAISPRNRGGARALLARDHPRLLCSLHAGGRRPEAGSKGRTAIDGLLERKGDPPCR